MPYIDSNDYSKLPHKTIVLYSDTTLLQIYFAQKYGWRNISGCKLKEMALRDKSKESRTKLSNYFSGKTKMLSLPDIKPLNSQAKNLNAAIYGKTIGGNMTLIQPDIGTPWQLQAVNKILFLEDVGVHGHKFDRLLVHFANSGILKGAKALIFGSIEQKELKILNKFAEKVSIPVFQTNNF